MDTTANDLKKCVLKNSLLVYQCDLANITGLLNLTAQKCLKCPLNYKPQNLATKLALTNIGFGVCLETTYIESTFTEYVANCQKYFYESTTLKCFKCNTKFFLEGQLCVATCTGTKIPTFLYNTVITPGTSAVLDRKDVYCDTQAFANCG